MTDAWREVLQGEINSEFDHVLDFAADVERAAQQLLPLAPLM